MSKKAESKVIYIGELERFGYTLTAAGTSKGAIIKALMAEYERAYEQRNPGYDPHETFDHWADICDYDNAKEDIYIRELELGKVEWC